MVWEISDRNSSKKLLGRPMILSGILKDTKTDVVVNYLPVGSEMATKWYVEQVLDAGCAIVNAIPVFISSSEYWAERFREPSCLFWR